MRKETWKRSRNMNMGGKKGQKQVQIVGMMMKDAKTTIM